MYVGILVMVFYFNTEMKGSFVTAMEGVDTERAVLLPEVSHQLCTTLVVCDDVGAIWVVYNLIGVFEPNGSEFRGLLLWFWVVELAANHNA